MPAHTQSNAMIIVTLWNGAGDVVDVEVARDPETACDAAITILKTHGCLYIGDKISVTELAPPRS